ncbi:MAG: RluA family pseudouridine synthase [Candidatus Omnitrophica bacterium]|nr:RluA family pseudouridine synthase [Candidatus Omnitrophota bacterium]
MTIHVLFENEDLFAVEKPEGISTVFERCKEVGCLVQSLRDITGLPLMPVHRLDKAVSGAVVFAKHPRAHRILNLMFDRREVHKTYAAVVHGIIEDRRGVIDKPIRQFGSGRMGVDEIRGKESITRFETVKSDSQYTWVKLMPDTGRRHQLRVHMYSIGRPIVGDPMYGDRSVQSGYPRLMLHSQCIEFSWNGEALQIASPIPETFL